jgi:hypothetical protein
MPIWLRKFTHNEIHLFYQKEKEEIQKSYGKEEITAQTDPNKIRQMAKAEVPNFVSKVKPKAKK